MVMKKHALTGQRKFPFECSDSYGVSEDFRELHWHKEMEICRIRNGHGKYLINGIEYAFEKNDIFIINNDDIHLCFDDDNLIMQVIMFDPSLVWSGSSSPIDAEYLRIFLNTGFGACNYLPNRLDLSKKLFELFDEIEFEYISKVDGFELVVKALLLQLLALINRHFISVKNNSYDNQIYKINQQGASLIINKKATSKIKVAVEYIDQYYYKKITLATLSNVSDMSIPYLCSTFKALSGISPIEYTIRKRIVKSKEELLETDHTILQIALNCGFGSLSNFNHSFKSYAGMSPSEYRKQ